MGKIYGIGETVYDIIFKDGTPQAARPGGSVLNCLVSLGRTGMPVSFISEYGTDDVGTLIDRFLAENGVNNACVYRYNDVNTSLAIAILDEKSDAHYTFYKEKPRKRLDIEFPDVNSDDIVMFGSFFAVSSDLRDKLAGFIHRAHENGAMIIYDPNFRKSHAAEIELLRPVLIENMRMASLVRGSDEDFRNIFGAENAEDAWSFVRDHCSCLVCTDSSKGVFVRTAEFSGNYPVRTIVPVSTVGAGDNFNAGIIAAIYKNSISRDDLSKIGEEKWKEIISAGVDFATEACLSYENYVSKEFAMKYKAGI